MFSIFPNKQLVPNYTEMDLLQNTANASKYFDKDILKLK